jgi:cell division protein FtsL
MLTKLNYLLLIVLSGFAIFAIYLNVNIYTTHRDIVTLQKQLATHTQINTQLELEIINKTSNNFVDTFATEELQMFLPKKIHTLDE